MNDKPIPFFKRFVIQNFPFIEEDFDALTNYQLFCKVVEYLNTVIGSQNEVTEQMEYVLNYFNTLDVQDEINNKLDQMAESGELTDLIAGYLNLKGILAYNTVADMKAADNLVDGSFAETYGFYSIGDGGSAKYKIRNITNADTVNERTLIALNNSTTLVAELVTPTGGVFVDQLGAKGDGETDDTAAIQFAIDNFNHVKFNQKVYFSKGVALRNGITIEGQSCNSDIYVHTDGTILKGDDTTVGFIMYNSENTPYRITIEGICLEHYTSGIKSINCNQSVFRDVICRHNTIGAEFGGLTWSNEFYNCSFSSNTSDGFQCGLPMVNPATSETINPRIATFDFHSCVFTENGGYGINGLMITFNFFGGYSEANTLGAVRIVSTSTYTSNTILFSGFDIEREDKGLFFDAGSSQLRVENVKYTGGQIALNSTVSGVQSAMYFKGSTCTAINVYGIQLNTRRSVSRSSDPNTYDVYVESTGTLSMIIDVDLTGNRNNGLFKTNLTFYLPCNITKMIDSSIPLKMAVPEHIDSNGNILVPASGVLKINIPNLVYVDRLYITTTGASSADLTCYGQLADNTISSTNQGRSSVVESGNNVLKFEPFCKSSIVVLKNNSSVNPFTISDIRLTGQLTIS